MEESEFAIPTEYNVEVDGDVFDVRIMPTGFMEIGEVDPSTLSSPVEGGLTSTMQGMILKLKVNEGDKVKKKEIFWQLLKL